jgi:prepilin-type N-terminal cleavage/methylation domain-containing protein
MQKGFFKKGFTLIELLVVISIISFLSSIVFASLQNARLKTRDSLRLQNIRQLQSALELYFSDNSKYPEVSWWYAQSYSAGDPTCGIRWCELQTMLSPYIKSLPKDPNHADGIFILYDSDPGDNYQSYALITYFEDLNNSIAANDGGQYAFGIYESGPQPSYCVKKYGAGANGTSITSFSSVCYGGN